MNKIYLILEKPFYVTQPRKIIGYLLTFEDVKKYILENSSKDIIFKEASRIEVNHD